MLSEFEKQMQLLQKKLQDGAKLSEIKEKEVVFAIIEALDQGQVRVCSQINGKWTTHSFLKQAILYFFQLQSSSVLHAGEINFFDKVPLKKWSGKEGVRVVPPAVARMGSFVEAGAILMPSFINIGAYVGSGTMVDTWATVGSCAQVGKNVHLSGGVGLGGVLEPLQANPVIIEDNVFVGSRCIVVEGAHIESGAVLGAGVTITASSKIIDVTQKNNPQTYVGRVPANSVVIPGAQEKEFPAGKYQVPCALIIGQRKPSTDQKTSLNQALRDFGVAV